MTTSTFLAVDRGRAQWALHAKVVHSVVSSQEWTGTSPFDIAEALQLEPGDGSDSGDDAPPSGAWPVILLAAEHDLVPLRAFGKLVFLQLDVDLVQPVPAIVRSPHIRQIVSGVVFADKGPPVVVLDPATLLSMAKEAAAA